MSFNFGNTSSIGTSTPAKPTFGNFSFNTPATTAPPAFGTPAPAQTAGFGAPQATTFGAPQATGFGTTPGFGQTSFRAPSFVVPATSAPAFGGFNTATTSASTGLGGTSFDGFARGYSL